MIENFEQKIVNYETNSNTENDKIINNINNNNHNIINNQYKNKNEITDILQNTIDTRQKKESIGCCYIM